MKLKREYYKTFVFFLLFLFPGSIQAGNVVIEKVASSGVGRSFVVVVLPDTQCYYDILSNRALHIFKDQTSWIQDNLIDKNIKFVVHLGDVVQNRAEHEWLGAVEAMNYLDGLVPYAITVGNHDTIFKNPGYVRNSEDFHKYFPLKNYSDLPSFGGVFEKGFIENSFHYFSGGGLKYLVIGLEYLPRDEVLEWANSVVKKHSNYRVIVFTHAYLHHDNDYVGEDVDPHILEKVKIEPPNGLINLGEDIWNKFIRKHENIFLVLNGHITFKTKGKDGVGHLISEGDHGNKVFQIGSNYQQLENGGNGFLRIMEFYPDENKIAVETFSPFLDEYKIDFENQFMLDLKKGQFVEAGK